MSELRIENWSMPAADLGEENPLPPLQAARELHAIESAAGIPEEMLRNMAYGHLPNILPYSIQDGYGRQLVRRDFRVAVLENELLRAMFLLELGGRLWSLVHKATGRELLYVNPVFQPGNLALRNAWFCGGVEWNIGTIGHSPFTCAPIFAARVKGLDGMPVLRMYEWERFRGVPFQIDAYLPDGSPVLYIRIRITNPNEHEVPMYWWSNIAVVENPNGRVVVPADSAYRFGYKGGGLELIPVPDSAETDFTYPTRINHSADFFFHVPSGQRPWIAALDGEGKGLVQVSTERLTGRKLFLWGMGAGGRKWQRFLSPRGGEYIEIQAGLARTQMEHLRMPARAEWSWLEAYGMLEADPGRVHGGDWGQARGTVAEALENLIPREVLEAEYARGAEFADQTPMEVVQHGSGWGKLEGLRRKAEGAAPFCSQGLVFDEASLGEEQAPWLELLRTGRFPTREPGSPPRGFLVQPEWRERLETSVARGYSENWLGWLHLGVMRFYSGDRSGARQAWERSLQHALTPWSLRNLALQAQEEGRTDDAVALYVDALHRQPALRPLAVECGRTLLEAGQPGMWLELLGELPPALRLDGRIRLLEAQAALHTGNLKHVERILTERPVVNDLREGETSLSHLWFEYHERRLSVAEGVPEDHVLRSRVRREFPVPEELDFRMVVEQPRSE